MSQAPSMPMLWDAYLADTTHLSTEEHGAYLLLLGAMWRRNGWVPDDDRDNARIIGMTPAKWRRTKERLRPLLMFADNGITQKNLLKIWKITQERIEKNRENGAKGGRPKSSDNKDIGKANGYFSDNPNETIPEPEPEPEIKEVVPAKAATTSAEQPRLSQAKSNDDDLLGMVMSAVGLTDGRTPTHWMPPAASIHVERWRSELGLTAEQIVDAAQQSRKRYPDPPGGPKALDNVMRRLSAALKAPALESSPPPQSGLAPQQQAPLRPRINPDDYDENGRRIRPRE